MGGSFSGVLKLEKREEESEFKLDWHSRSHGWKQWGEYFCDGSCQCIIACHRKCKAACGEGEGLWVMPTEIRWWSESGKTLQRRV